MSSACINIRLTLNSNSSSRIMEGECTVLCAWSCYEKLRHHRASSKGLVLTAEGGRPNRRHYMLPAQQLGERGGVDLQKLCSPCAVPLGALC